MEEKKLKCPECDCEDLVKAGVVWSGRDEVQRYLCTKCGRTTVKPENNHQE